MQVRLIVALLGAAACGGSDASSTPPVSTNKTVDIYTIGEAFSPTFETITVGDTVRWNFSSGSDGQGHNVRFTPRIQGAPNDLPVHSTGTALSIFTTRGDFHYVCDVHPGMLGEVSVQ